MVGVGSDTGKVSDKLWTPVDTVARGADPPPESVRADGTAAGDMVPSAFWLRVVSTGIQLPARFVRTGCKFVVQVNDPSGFATVCDSSEVSASTVTGVPVDFAVVEATVRGSVEADGELVVTVAAAMLADADIGNRPNAGIAKPSTAASDVRARLPRDVREGA
jgi:hypothetical protein